MSPNGQPDQQQAEVPESKVNFELGRLGTFDDNWKHPDDSICSKLNMARAGFFYLGRDDIVQCFCCAIKLGGWEPAKDNPLHKHRDTCTFGIKGKREGQLTLAELMDVFANKGVHQVDARCQKITARE